MAEERLAEITNLLLEQTRSGAVEWEKTTQRNQYQTSFARYSVIISGSSDAPNLRLCNEDGEVVEELTGVGAIGLGAFDSLKALFEAARRRALGADQAIDELLKLLREQKKPET
jgi:hypothetical protein